MKNLVFAFALLCSTSLVAQFSYNANGTGIQSPTNTASGFHSNAIGFNTIASRDYSFASGAATNSSGFASTAMGYDTTASVDFSTAMGSETTASGFYSTAMGSGTQASGYYSTAMGSETTASGQKSTAMGFQTIASGDFSSASGGDTTAEDYFSFAIGSHNKTDETPNPSAFSYQNTAFVIGNGGFDSDGSYDGHLSNALEVLFDGTTTIAGNVTAPAFIGDGSQLTNLPLSFNATSGNGIESVTNTASGDNSTAMGSSTTASARASTAVGMQTTASGIHSTAMGEFTKSKWIYIDCYGI